MGNSGIVNLLLYLELYYLLLMFFNMFLIELYFLNKVALMIGEVGFDPEGAVLVNFQGKQYPPSQFMGLVWFG